MKRKLMIKYGLLCLPFVCGSVLYVTGSYNIVSSLLFFVGGYVAIKNLCDYRKINKNIRLVNDRENKEVEIDTNDRDKSNEEIISKKIELSGNMDFNNDNYKGINKYRSYDSIPGIKSTRRYIKVRRRIK